MTRIDPTRLHALIKLMLENEDQERYGYELLLEERDPAAYFDALSEAMLFERSRVQLEKTLDITGAHYANKPWAPVEYLLRCAKTGDRATDHKVLKVVERIGNGSPPLQNYLVQAPFAEMLGAVALDELRHTHIALVIQWLNSETYTWPTVHALATGLLPKLVASRPVEHVRWACEMIEALTVFRVDTPSEERAGRIGFRHDEHLVGDMLEKNAPTLASHAGSSLLPVLLRRCREYFGAEQDQGGSFWKRPAIEDHEQNRDYEAVPKALVDTTRSAMLAWIDSDLPEASKQIPVWLKDEAEIVRRLTINLLSERYAELRDSVSVDLRFVQGTLFAYGHLHESYRFLHDCFEKFTLEEQSVTVDAIRLLSLSKGSEIPGLRETEKLRWLSAIKPGANREADVLRSDLLATVGVVLPDHPDFYFYISSGWSGSKSPLTIPEVLAHCESDQLIQYANSFSADRNDWDGPSVRGLCDAIEAAIVESPDLFFDKIESLRDLSPPYQYAVLRGFVNVLEKRGTKFNWESAWPELLSTIEALFAKEDFWVGVGADGSMADPDAGWVPSVVAELLRKGASSDDILAVDTQLTRSLSLIEILIEKCERLDDPGTDVVSSVINTPFGKAIEALFAHALRIRRCEKNYLGETARALLDRTLQKFDFELARSGIRSIEFSTLAGNYINHLRYIDETWLLANFAKLFPLADPVRLRCVIAGFAYAKASLFTYEHLVVTGAIEAALEHELPGRHARQQLLRHVGLAYLWGIESLDSKRFVTLKLRSHLRDLKEVINLIRSAPPAADASAIKRIVDFWRFCLDAYDRSASDVERKEIWAPCAGLVKHLPGGSLIEEHKDLIRAVAPYAWYPHDEIFFVPELLRLLPDNEEFIGARTVEFLQAMPQKPVFDFEGRYLQIVRHLESNHLPTATEVRNELRHIREFRDSPNAISSPG